MIEPVTAKRIEILCDSPLVPRVVAMMQAAGIKGWSVLRVESGGGRDGRWQDDEPSGTAAKSIVLAIARADTAQAFAGAAAPLLDSHGLLLCIGDVSVIRAERF